MLWANMTMNYPRKDTLLAKADHLKSFSAFFKASG